MVYDAFISYSHSSGAVVAPVLRNALQRFAKPWWKTRALRVFRDETNLSASHDLTGDIADALRSARYFILLASPEAAASKWVDREARLWLAEKPADHVLIALTGGRIVWDEARGDFDRAQTDALPSCFSGAFRAEPLWVDLTFAETNEQATMRDARFQQAVARLAAPIHGKSLDEISGEEVRQNRRTRRIVQGATATIAALAVAAAIGGWRAHVAQLAAERNLGQALAALDAIETAVAHDLQNLSGVSVSKQISLLQRAEHVLDGLDESDVGARRERAVMAGEFSAAYVSIGAYTEATSRAEQAIGILGPIIAAAPDDLVAEAALAKSRAALGDALLRQRKSLAEAARLLRLSAETYATLAAIHPDRAESDDWTLQGFRATLEVGDADIYAADHPGPPCAERQACLAEAKSAFAQAQAVASTALPHDGPDLHWKNATLVARERLARTDLALGDPRAAQRTYAESLAEYQRMSEAQPENTRWRENMMALHWRVGGLAEAACQWPESHAHYARALDGARRLHLAEPDDVDWARDLATSLRHLARAEAALGGAAEARRDAGESRDLLLSIIERQPANEDLKGDLAQVEAALANDAPPRCGADAAAR